MVQLLNSRVTFLFPSKGLWYFHEKEQWIVDGIDGEEGVEDGGTKTVVKAHDNMRQFFVPPVKLEPHVT